MARFLIFKEFTTAVEKDWGRVVVMVRDRRVKHHVIGREGLSMGGSLSLVSTRIIDCCRK